MSSAQDELNHHPTARMFGKIRKRFQSLGNRALAICAATALVVCVLEVLRLPPVHPELSDAELRLEDHYFLLRNYLWPNGSWKSSAINDIVLVSVDEESARKIGLGDTHQWPKSVFAGLIKKLNQANADVIVLDVPLDATTELKSTNNVTTQPSSAPSSLSVGADTTAGDGDAVSNSMLLDALQHSKNVVLTSGVDKSPTTGTGTTRDNSLVLLRSPGAPFIEAVGEDSGSVGNNVIVADQDGLVRHGKMLFDQLGPSFYKSLALRVIEKKIGARSIVDDRDFVYLRDRLIPTNVRINFAGAPGTYRTIPLWRALDWEKQAQHGWFDNAAKGPSAQGADSTLDLQNPFKNKVVLIGIFEPSVPGMSQQRFSYGSSVSNFLTPAAPPPTPMNGIEIQANLIVNILQKSFLAEPDQWELLLLIVFIGLLVGRVLARCAYRPFLSLSAMVLVTAVWLVVSFYAFVALRILIPVVVPVVGVAWPAAIIVLLDQYFKIKREKAKQTKLFRSLAAKPLANEIERRLLAELGLTGKLMNVTVAACQLHDFSLDLDDRSPEYVLQSLNQCLGVMMATIGEHGGLVERVWNCGVIGLWGAPIAMDEAAQVAAATKCIGDMRARLRALTVNDQNHKSPFGLTCSINSGDAICGTIDAGSKDSSLVQYGALGPSVDLAMQLDSFNAQYGTTCILGANTARSIPESDVRELDRITVGAREQSQPIFELLSVDGALPGLYEEAMELFRQGRHAFEDGRFREAEQLFATGAGMVPNDKATAIMLERCRTVLSKSEAKHT
ncbi:MAG: adenylate/guanylate cyclase domain-containing protein [Cyanobacteria bacterium SZAS-4]|nr:adenylate/guanylate cyclase domain-containing protein [Cyanobacteria bacterium SZAS-4]